MMFSVGHVKAGLCREEMSCLSSDSATMEPGHTWTVLWARFEDVSTEKPWIRVQMGERRVGLTCL